VRTKERHGTGLRDGKKRGWGVVRVKSTVLPVAPERNSGEGSTEQVLCVVQPHPGYGWVDSSLAGQD